jgi:hypothetical protein
MGVSHGIKVSAMRSGAIRLAVAAMLSAVPCYAFDQRDLKSCKEDFFFVADR